MKEKRSFQKTEYINDLVEKYAQMLFRICFCILGNKQDAEDALQDTFVKYLTKAPDFDTQDYEKAWLIKVATNISKNIQMLKIRRSAVNIDDMHSVGVQEEDSQVFEAIMNLPVKYKIVMVLHYIEGYSSKEIAEIIYVSDDAVRKRLQKGRDLLKKEMERLGECDVK